MSWDSYIDNLIGHTAGNCDKACIIGLDGSLWTSHAPPNALKLAEKEAVNIGKSMRECNFAPFQASGIHAESIKYQFLREDEGVVLGKKKDHGAITIQKSKTAVVIGHTKEGGQQGNVNKGVAVIAEYLESLGM